jgi:hypothetical protein
MGANLKDFNDFVDSSALVVRTRYGYAFGQCDGFVIKTLTRQRPTAEAKVRIFAESTFTELS